MDIVLEMKKDYWSHFNEDLYSRYLKAKINLIKSE